MAYSLYLKNKVLVREFPVRLSDLARIDGSKNLAEKVVLASADSAVFLPSDRFQDALADGPEKLERIYGKGVWVVPLTQSRKAAELSRTLEEEIRKHPDGKAYLEMHTIQLDSGAELWLPPGDSAVEFQFPARLQSFSAGRRMLAVDIVGEEKPGSRKQILHRQQIALTIFKKVRVAVASRDLNTGIRLTAGDYSIVEKLLDGDEKRYAVAPLDGLRVMQPVRAGDILLRSIVQKMPVVRRGQQLTLVVQSPGLVLKSRSVALNDADAGESVSVRPLLPAGQKNNALKARVVDESHAVLEGNP